MAWKQWPVVQKSDCLFIFKNTKTVVSTNDFAEGAVFIERVGWRAHTRSRKTILQGVRIRSAKKTAVLSTWVRRGPNIRRLCGLVQSQWPIRSYSWDRLRRQGDRDRKSTRLNSSHMSI